MQAGHVEVWLADLDAAAASLDALEARQCLCPCDERVRAGGISDQVRALRWTRSRIALRLLLASQVGLRQARAPFFVAAGGKPRLSATQVQFSLSHSGALLVVAISHEAPVGVDVETRTAVSMDDARQAAIERGAAALAPCVPLPDEPPLRRFLQAWARVEAVAKASGAGVGSLLEQLSVRGTGTPEPAPVAQTLVADGWPLRVEDLALGSAAVGAVALSANAKLQLRVFPSSPEGVGALEGRAQSGG